MPSRYSRDELILHALDMVQLPNLEGHDAPDGVVVSDAFCIQWLQDIIDFWYHLVPFSATVTSTPFNWAANVATMILPDDFILDVRNGYVVQSTPGNIQSMKRVRRIPFQKFLPWSVRFANGGDAHVSHPYFYCVLGRDGNNQIIHVTPVPTINVVGLLWYYQLPAKLEANDRPIMPNDYVCVEYLRIRALEWSRSIEPGTAQKFCDRLIGAQKAAGLLNEPEDDEIPLDTLTFRGGIGEYGNTYAWMGPV